MKGRSIVNVQIKLSCEDHRPAIDSIAIAAFGEAEGEEIVYLINALMIDKSAQPVLSLVASTTERVVGHILFSRAGLVGAGREISAMLLAPLAVHPDFQGKGIGGRLVEEGLRRLKQAGNDLVFVLGHPGYYPRFGFVEAGVNGFQAPYPILAKNAGAWMVHAMRPGLINEVDGRVICAASIDDVKYWQE